MEQYQRDIIEANLREIRAGGLDPREGLEKALIILRQLAEEASAAEAAELCAYAHDMLELLATRWRRPRSR